jgi:diguanylate cyclase (GGDEF)-like protein/PAS domain S-box-containing protein
MQEFPSSRQRPPESSHPRSDLEEFWTTLQDRRHDLEALLRLIAERVVAILGDGCVITTVSGEGTTLQPRAIVHSDPTVARAMRAVLGGKDARIGEGIAGTAAADRRTIVLNGLEPEVVAETTPEQFLPFVRDHPMRAIAVVPLHAAGELVGTLGSIRTSSDAPYSAEDQRLLESLADRAALAIADAIAGPRTIGPADFEAIYRYNPEGVLLTTPDGHILAANPAACAILGMTEREILQRGREGLIDPNDPRLAPALAERTASGHARAELTMHRGDGSTFVASVSSTIFTTPDHKVRATVIFRDVSDEVAARELAMARVVELERTAGRDPLTGLWNRRGFTVAAEHALATAERQNVVAQVVFVDIDGLKELNDTRGHTAGDAALVAVASAIDRALREVDVAGRIGGDEFVFLVVDTPSEDVHLVIERISAELGTDPGAPDMLTFSFGVVERPAHSAATLSELVHAADQDMYQRKVLRRLRQPEP